MKTKIILSCLLVSIYSCSYFIESNKIIKTKQSSSNVSIDTIIEYYPSGGIMEKYIEVKKDGKVFKDGLHQIFEEDGTRLLECTYMLDKRDGLYTTWYSNDNVEFEGNYTNNKAIGILRWYFSNGRLQSEEEYKDSIRDGFFYYYYDNGEIKSQGYYVGGILNGKFKAYYPNGDTQVIREYQNGKIIYEQKEFKKTLAIPGK